MRIAPALALLAFSGCATAPPQPPLTAAEYLGEDPVETAARLLAIADGSEGTRHAQAVGALGRLGARPYDGEADLVTKWAASLPPDERPPLRGRLLGPAYRSGTLAPGAVLATAQVFEGGKPARVSLSGEKGAPLAITVGKGDARPVCDTEPGPLRNCRWTPPFSGRYEIEVRNAAREPVRYFLVIG